MTKPAKEPAPISETPDGRSNGGPTVRRIVPAAFVLTIVCAIVYLSQPGFVAYFNYKWMDAIERNASAPDGRPTDSTPAVIVVDIDEYSLSTYGQWPWPRYRLAELLDRINRLDPGSMALTFILAEPDRTSLNSIQAELKQNFGYTLDSPPWPAELLDNDAFLARTLATGPYVLGFKLLFGKEGTGTGNCAMHPLTALTVEKAAAPLPADHVYRTTRAICNLPHLNQAVRRSGYLNGSADADGRMRRLPLVMRWNDRLYPTLALAALLEALRDAPVTLRRSGIGQNYLEVSEKAIPMDARGNVRIRFGANEPSPRHLSAAAILRGEVDPADFKEAIVFVGLSAAGLDAAYASPRGEALSAAEVHARMAQTLLESHHISRPEVMRQLEILAALALSILFGACIVRMEFMGVTMTGIGGVVLLQSLSQLLFRRTGILFSPLLPAAALLTNWLTLMLYKYFLRQQAARRQALRAMHRVKRSEKELDAIMKAIPDIVFRLNPQGCITFISSAVGKYGKRPEDLIARPMLDLVVPEQRGVVTHRITERRTGRRATSDLEVRLLLTTAADGDAEADAGRFFSLSTEGVYRQEASGSLRFVGTQGIARDIHRRKKLEEQLEQAKKMEAIGGLAAGVAHDLNNLLSGLVSYPELLLLELPADSPLRDKVEIIRQSGQQAADVVQDMLCIARRGVQDYEIVQLNDVVQMFLAMPALRKIREQHPRVEIQTTLADDLLNIKGSIVHLTKLLLNLVNNAAEAMPTGGTILLATQNRYLDIEVLAYEKIPAGEYVLLTVADQGVGIPPEYLQRIFEPFFSKKKMGRSGSGLGMTVVWGTVKDHGGCVDLDSREGQGTRFTIYLPATREEKPAAPQRVVLEDCIGDEKILIVDDSPDQREIAAKILSKLGYQVATAASGEEAVAYLQNQPADLVVLDMIMPDGLDGLDTFRRLREIRPDQRAIIVSGYSESARVQTMLELGAGAYVRKPYTLEKIGLAVRRVLDRKTQA